MEKLTETPLLKFNPNTLEEVRKELNLHHDGVLEQMITSLEEWISKQNHFTQKKIDRRYLETLIINGKGSLERVKKTLDKLCTLKTLLPHFFSKYDAKNDLIDTSGFLIYGTMPKLMKDNYRLYMIKLISSNFDSAMLFDYLRSTILAAEYMKQYDYYHGLVVFLDCRNINLMNFVTKINVMDLHTCMSVLIQGYSVRIKAIHLISSSKAIGAFVAILKQVTSAKIANRIVVHDTVEAFHEHVPKEIMPAEYGGNEKSLKEINDQWVNELSSKDNVAFLKKSLSAGTDEKYRLPEKFNEQILGMPGSFRTLTVD